jgi:ADP-ribose pyrophosphatase YjhB (NUDIX family)
MSRRVYPKKPLVGVGATVFRNDQVLLIRRGNPPLYGDWSLPGGRVKKGEDLKKALRREIREECSIDIEVGDLITEFEYIERDEVTDRREGTPFGATECNGVTDQREATERSEEVPSGKVPFGRSRVKYHYVVFDFKAQYVRGKLVRATDALEVRWVPLEQLKEFDLSEEVCEVIEKGYHQ